jgi:hypothetical protein
MRSVIGRDLCKFRHKTAQMSFPESTREEKESAASGS